jgi:hypothetical protein
MNLYYKKFNPEIVKKLDKFVYLLYSVGGFDPKRDYFDFGLTKRSNDVIEQVDIYVFTSFYFDGFEFDLRTEIDSIDKKMSLVLNRMSLDGDLNLVKQPSEDWSNTPMITKINYDATIDEVVEVELNYFLYPNF